MYTAKLIYIKGLTVLAVNSGHVVGDRYSCYKKGTGNKAVKQLQLMASYFVVLLTETKSKLIIHIKLIKIRLAFGKISFSILYNYKGLVHSNMFIW